MFSAKSLNSHSASLYSCNNCVPANIMLRLACAADVLSFPFFMRRDLASEGDEQNEEKRGKGAGRKGFGSEEKMVLCYTPT